MSNKKVYFVYYLTSPIDIPSIVLSDGKVYSFSAGAPLYVGKGKAKCRGVKSDRNEDVKIVRQYIIDKGKKCGIDLDIRQTHIIDNKEEPKAFDIERNLIAEHGGKNALLNRTDGNGDDDGISVFGEGLSFSDQLLLHNEYGNGKKKNVSTPRRLADKLTRLVDWELISGSKGRIKVLFAYPDLGETIYSFLDNTPEEYKGKLDIYITEDIEYTGSVSHIRFRLKEEYGISPELINLDSIPIIGREMYVKGKSGRKVKYTKDRKMKKFDVCVTNPPYNGNTDLTILKNVIPHCKQVIAIHPTTWLIGKKKQQKSQLEYRDMIRGHIKSAELFNGNSVFNIGLFGPVGIFDIRDAKVDSTQVSYFGDNYVVDDIDDITQYGPSWVLVKPLYDMMKEGCKSDNLWNHRLIKDNQMDDTKHQVQLSTIRGHINTKSITTMTTDDFYTLVMLDSDNNKGHRFLLERPGNIAPTFQFDTEEEQNNLIEYLKTDFVRFCLSFYKTGANTGTGQLSIIPWLDFTQRWTDKELFDMFDVSPELQNYIKTFLPDYYGIRNDGQE